MDYKPPVPHLEILFHAAVKIGQPQMIGPVPTGERRVIPIGGGRFEGARLRGEIIAGGADWQIVALDGTALVEARYTLRTDDGALILVRNAGVRHGPAEVLAAIGRGEDVDPQRYYFRTTATFEAGSPKYSWLNKLVAVGSGVRRRDEVLIDFYEVK